MPYSYATTVASGSSNLVTIPFPYLSKSDVHIYLNEQEVPQDTFTWNSGSIVALQNTPAAGVKVRVQRITDISEAAVVFTDGPLPASDLNTSVTWLMYALQEKADSEAYIDAHAIQAPDESSMANLITPTAASRALQLLGWDSEGNVGAYQPTSTMVSSAMQPIVAAATVADAFELFVADGPSPIDMASSGFSGSLSAGVGLNITSTPIGSGTWEVTGAAWFVGTPPTTIDWLMASISTSSQKLGPMIPNTSPVKFYGGQPFSKDGTPHRVTVGPVTVTGPGTVYLVGLGAFDGGLIKVGGALHVAPMI